MKFFGQIEKTYKDDKGFLVVCGHASTEALDSQGEVVKREAVEGALGEWVKVGNIREMHQPSAVGKAVLARMDDKGLYLEAKIVDPVASLKCEEGVYTGFSIGGKCTSRDPMAKNTITGLRLTEISIVDRPANPEASFTLFKLDDELDEEVGVEKGMGHVADLAWMLKALGYMVNDQANEAEREGDTSPIPAKLQAWLVQGGEILKEMTAEEVQELVAASGQNLVPDSIADAVVQEFQDADAATQNAVQMADTAADVEKIGAKFSQETKDKLITIINTIKENLGNLNSLVFPEITTDLTPIADAVANPDVYAQPEGERGTSGTPVGFPDTSPNGDLAKPVGDPAGVHAGGKKGEPTKADEPEDIKKSHDDDLAKIASLASEVEKLISDKETLEKRVAELEAEPAPPKVKLLAIPKGSDVVKSDPRETEIEKLEASKDPVQIAKAIHLRGGRRGFPM